MRAELLESQALNRRADPDPLRVAVVDPAADVHVGGWVESLGAVELLGGNPLDVVFAMADGGQFLIELNR